MQALLAPAPRWKDDCSGQPTINAAACCAKATIHISGMGAHKCSAKQKFVLL